MLVQRGRYWLQDSFKQKSVQHQSSTPRRSGQLCLLNNLNLNSSVITTTNTKCQIFYLRKISHPLVRIKVGLEILTHIGVFFLCMKYSRLLQRRGPIELQLTNANAYTHYVIYNLSLPHSPCWRAANSKALGAVEPTQGSTQTSGSLPGVWGLGFQKVLIDVSCESCSRQDSSGDIVLPITLDIGDTR